MTGEAKTFTCSRCQECRESKPNKKGVRVIPRGWKTCPRGNIVCDTCVNAGMVTRAFELPVVEPLSCTWEQLDATLAEAWNESTALANWAMHQLLVNDVTILPGMAKLPKMPPIYLYDRFGAYARREQWDGATKAGLSVLTEVEKDWRKARMGVLWRRNAAPPTYRYPHPYPASAPKCEIIDSAPIVTLPMPGGSVRLRLRQGQQWRRQMAQFRQIVLGEAWAGEGQVLRRRLGSAPGSDDQREINGGPVGQTSAVRKPKGRRGAYRTCIKFVARFLKRPAGEREVAMVARTDPAAFVRCLIDDRELPWSLNVDHIRRSIISHAEYRQRMSEDMKHEKRWPKRDLIQMKEALERRCDTQNDRLDNFVHTATRMIAELARRHRVASVTYDATCKMFAQSFPWYDFHEKLTYKLDEYDITISPRPGCRESDGD